MEIEVRVPELNNEEDTTTISFWYKKEGDDVEKGEDLVELETKSRVINIKSPTTGILKEILYEEGDEVNSHEVIAIIVK